MPNHGELLSPDTGYDLGRMDDAGSQTQDVRQQLRLKILWIWTKNMYVNTTNIILK